MQPYFLPYIGYWQLINLVDQFVIYDDVNFIKKGFINRNSILVNNNSFLFTLPLIKASQNKKINEIFLNGTNKKLIKTIYESYKKAPFFDVIFPMIEEIFHYDEKCISRFIVFSLKRISEYLNIKSNFIFSSSINYNKSYNSQNKLIDICKVLDTKHYINLSGGVDMYNKEAFGDENIILSFLKTNKYSYEQFKNPFISDLSIIDVLMFNDISSINKLLNNYKLF